MKRTVQHAVTLQAVSETFAIFSSHEHHKIALLQKENANAVLQQLPQETMQALLFSDGLPVGISADNLECDAAIPTVE
jgi:hypothetical protein